MHHPPSESLVRALYTLRALPLALCSLALFASALHAAEGDADAGQAFQLGGDARVVASVNLQDHPETRKNDRGELSMLRGALMLDSDLKTGPVLWKATGRIDRENKTSYLNRIEQVNRSNVNTLAASGPRQSSRCRGS